MKRLLGMKFKRMNFQETDSNANKVHWIKK